MNLFQSQSEILKVRKGKDQQRLLDFFLSVCQPRSGGLNSLGDLLDGLFSLTLRGEVLNLAAELSVQVSAMFILKRPSHG